MVFLDIQSALKKIAELLDNQDKDNDEKVE